MTSSVDSTASDLTPRSTPTTESGRAGAASWRSTSTENEQNHRPPRWVTVAERTRPVPRSICRASLRVDSWARTRPMRGSLTCLRSVSARPTAPVVNRHDNPTRLPLNRGNFIFRPARVPLRDADQLPNAVARFARPEEYASFEFSPHHGAISSLAWFHSFRRLYADHDSDGVS